MKASEVVKNISKIIMDHGDLEVGIYDNEYSRFCEINSICTTKSDDVGVFADDKELGERFIAIR